MGIVIDTDRFDKVEGSASLNISSWNTGEGPLAGGYWPLTGSEVETGLRMTSSIERDVGEETEEGTVPYDLTSYEKISVYAKASDPVYSFAGGEGSAEARNNFKLSLGLGSGGDIGESSEIQEVTPGGSFQEFEFPMDSFDTSGGLDLSSVDSVRFTIESPNVDAHSSLLFYQGVAFGWKLDYLRALPPVLEE